MIFIHFILIIYLSFLCIDKRINKDSTLYILNYFIYFLLFAIYQSDCEKRKKCEIYISREKKKIQFFISYIKTKNLVFLFFFFTII